MRKLIYFLLFIVVILGGCAKRSAPPGGPEDKTPPFVIEALPLNGAVNVPLDNSIKITFSERVRLNRGDIFISPPLKDAKFKRTSKGFTLEHKSPLRSRTTYIVSVSSDVKDLHNNPMSAGFQLAFSTGEKLDSLSLSGTVYSNEWQRQKGTAVCIYHYPLSDSLTIPDYIAWTDSIGNFSAKYLPDGNFLVMAAKELAEGSIPNFDADYGISSPCHSDSGVYLPACRSKLAIRLAKRDTLFPSVQLVNQMDRYSFRLRFSSEVVGDESIVLSSIPQIDGVKCITEGKSQELVFYRKSPIDTGNYQLLLNAISTPDGRAFFVDSLFLHIKELPDTLPVRITEQYPGKKGEKLPINDTITITFNKPITGGIIFVQDSSNKTIDGKTIQINPYTLGFTISNKVDYDGKARYKPDNINVKSATALEDTSCWQSFIILGRKHYGAVVVHPVSLPDSVIVSLAPTGAPENSIPLQPSDTGYTAPSVIEGHYLLIGFIDENSDGRHSAGSIKPLIMGEPLFVYPDTLTIRGRWTTDISW